MEESASMEIQLATASINNEDQSTQKEADIPGVNEKRKRNDELVIEIREIVERPKTQSSTRCRIHKVPRPIRKWMEEAYTPQVVSIGPFHHKNKRLKSMEEYKERYFQSFVERSEIKLEYLVETISEMEESIRGCYAETIDLTSDRFVKMISVDACFILELFLQTSLETSPLIEEPRAIAVMLDLLLLENQLPFFVIEKLCQPAFPSLYGANSYRSNYDALLNLSLDYFGYLSIQFTPEVHPNVKIEHFTDLLRTFQLPPLEKRPKRSYSQNNHNLSYTATQLHEAGVTFQVVESECDLDIKFEEGVKFEKGVLKIPRIVLSDWTEVITRNIMALEQTRYIEAAYFTDYLFLMDSLINTREDVDLLCDNKILVNYLGDNNAAKSMINNLNKGIEWIAVRNDYIHLYSELNGFYENPWHKRQATLKREYFSTPWRGASTVAAIVLLVLTFIQTACSLFK